MYRTHYNPGLEQLHQHTPENILMLNLFIIHVINILWEDMTVRLDIYDLITMNMSDYF
jgi:hypothetical protein